MVTIIIMTRGTAQTHTKEGKTGNRYSRHTGT